MSGAARRAIAVAIGALAIAGGCRDRAPAQKGGAAGSSTASSVTGAAAGSGAAGASWLAACSDGLGNASLAPPRERVGLVLAACVPCGPGWGAIARAETGSAAPADVLAVVDACGGACKATARSVFEEALTDVAGGDGPALPWRQLARACPESVGVDEPSARYASATWYALTAIARGLARGGTAPVGGAAPVAAEVLLPLPARSVAGTGYTLPTSTSPDAIDPRLPRLHVSVTASGVTVGALAMARLGGGTLSLLPVPGAPYPGKAATTEPGAAVDTRLASQLDALAHALEPAVGGLDGPVLLAPRALPAARALEVLRALADRRAYLAVAVGSSGAPATTAPATTAPAIATTAPASGWPDVPAPALPAFAGPAPGRSLVLLLGGGAIGVTGGWGGLAASAQLPPGADEATRAATAVKALVGADPGLQAVIVIDATAEATTADLAALLAQLARAGVPSVAAAPHLRWPAKLPGFDPQVLRAAQAAPARPATP